MSDTATREERRSALDDFADVKTDSSGGAMVPAAAGAQPTNLVFGAQAVAVRRDERTVLAKVKTLAAAAGDDWYYRFPVKDNKTGKTSWIEGPSIKLANDIARLYGNCEVDCRAQDFGNVILFHARFVDLETGFALTRPFQQRKGASKLGGSDEARREDITFQIGASKAIRNVVVNALQTFADFAFEEAKQALVDKIGRDIERWRTRTIERISARVDLKRVEAVIGRPADKWLAPDIARVIAMGKAVDDGMATWEETFPPLGPPPQTEPDQAALDKFAGEADEKKQFDAASTAGVEQTAAATEQAPLPSAAAVADQPEIIDKLLQLATEKVSAEDRLQTLDVTQLGLLDRYPATAHGFVKQAVATAAKVIKGELSLADARKYLEALVGRS